MIEQFFSPFTFLFIAWAAKFGLSQQSILAFWGVALLTFLLVFTYGSKLIDKFARYFLPGILLVLVFLYHEQLTVLISPYIEKQEQ